MGSIFPGFEGPRWDKLGYDSYDFDKCTRFVAYNHGKPTITSMRKWRVLATRNRRCTVFAEGVAEARRRACELCGWVDSDIHCVRMLFR